MVNSNDIWEEKVMLLGKTAVSAKDVGLYNGKSGALLGLYAVLSKLSTKGQAIVLHMIELIQEDISENAGSTDDTYNNGIFGIGWAVNMLYEQQHIQENKIEVMNSFDDELYKLIMYQKAELHDLERGTLGRINYYLKRINEYLKATNIYRYVCNYESLMLLVDDFTTENENIILQFNNGLLLPEQILENSIFYSNIYNLLCRLVDKNIHPEITERQQAENIKIFKCVFDNLINNKNVVWESSDLYWGAIAIINCLLRISKESNKVQEFLSLDKQFLEELMTANIPCRNIQELLCYFNYRTMMNPNCFSFPKLADNLYLQGDVINCGLNGLGGKLYLMSMMEHNSTDILSEAFLL